MISRPCCNSPGRARRPRGGAGAAFEAVHLRGQRAAVAGQYTARRRLEQDAVFVGNVRRFAHENAAGLIHVAAILAGPDESLN